MSAIPFIDLKTQQAQIRDRIEARLKKVLDHGAYIMGPEVQELEAELSNFCGAKHTLSCASGTDALLLSLMAKDLKPGDVVFVPAFTFVATAEVVALLGGIPFFVDVDPKTYNISVESLKDAYQQAQDKGLRAAGVIPVDLFGLPADYKALHDFAQEKDLWVIGDAAQSFGARVDSKPVGTLAELTCTSFFPAKPLGAYGDGGAVFTDDDALLEKLQSMRVHGQGSHRYEHVRLGITGRLDSMQAAILLEKLAIFSDELKKRQVIADRYQEAFKGLIQTPEVPDGMTSAWAIYTLQAENRNQIMDYLKGEEVPAVIYYPIPLADQPAYTQYPSADLTVTRQLSQQVFSIPMHPYLSEEVQDKIIKTLKNVL